MRPSWDWGHGKPDVPSGTPRHTSETPPGALDEDESFFQAGDEGRYEGGPALLTEEPIELDDAPVALVVRTPEQDARRARLVRVVAMAVGAFAALFAFGVVKQRKAGAQEPPARVSANVESATQSQRRDVSPEVVQAPAPVPAKLVAAPEPAPAPAPEPVEAKKPIAKVASWTLAVVEEPTKPAAKPVVVTAVTAVPQGQTSGGGSVGNFASRGPGSDTPRGSMPTASFPVQ